MNGADPLTSLTIPLYAAPTVPMGKVAVGIVGSGTMYRLAVTISVGLATPVAVMVAVSPAFIEPVYVAVVVVILLSDPGPESAQVTP